MNTNPWCPLKSPKPIRRRLLVSEVPPPSRGIVIMAEVRGRTLSYHLSEEHGERLLSKLFDVIAEEIVRHGNSVRVKGG